MTAPSQAATPGALTPLGIEIERLAAELYETGEITTTEYRTDVSKCKWETSAHAADKVAFRAIARLVLERQAAAIRAAEVAKAEEAAKVVEQYDQTGDWAGAINAVRSLKLPSPSPEKEKPTS